MPEEVDILIRGGTLLPMTPDAGPEENGILAIRQGRIVAVEKSGGHSAYSAKKAIHAHGKLIMPGLINTHTHAPMSCFRGIADDLPLMDWLRNYIFPLEARFLNPEVIYWSTLLSCVEMMLSGTTTFADGYFFEESAAQAVEDAGLRGLLCPGIVDFPAPGVPDPARNVECALEAIRKGDKGCSRIRWGIFAHSVYTCSPQTLQCAKEVAREEGLPFFIHLSESREEIREVRERFGCSPVRHLEALGLLDEQTVGVHCVWLTRRDIDRLAQGGAAVAFTPESEMKLASGIPPAHRLLKKGVPLGLGTDGPASNNDLDMFSEMATTAKLFKVRTFDPTCFPARQVVETATIGGARVLGWNGGIGSLEVGKRADVILLDLLKPHLTPLYDYYSHLVYAVKSSDVDTVIVDGKVLVENRRVLHLDVARIMEEVHRFGETIRGMCARSAPPC